MLSKCVCGSKQQRAAVMAGGQGSGIAASCHTPDLKRQCANPEHTRAHIHNSHYTQGASLEEMKHHCHTQAHTNKHTSQPQVFSFVVEGNKRQRDNERRWLPLREATNERSRDGRRTGRQTCCRHDGQVKACGGYGGLDEQMPIRMAFNHWPHVTVIVWDVLLGLLMCNRICIRVTCMQVSDGSPVTLSLCLGTGGAFAWAAFVKKNPGTSPVPESPPFFLFIAAQGH